MNTAIRKMKLEDTKQVQSVARLTWKFTYKDIIPLAGQEKFLDSAYSDDSMKRRLEHSIIFVAEHNNEIIGFANYSNAKKSGEVELGAIYVDPRYQNRGTGTLLLNQGLNHIKGLRKLYLNVQKENKIGKNFYLKKGFNIVEEFNSERDQYTSTMLRMALTK
ncbi:GNAT family N-acetyltransferase [Marinilactibacillus sp. GCM10026970]|uniref:GNAT family N-acetyltransferase n=1 Tax=Marinilactibacillus sp. GCM10026970 TaxID=3252642 RepID=UPI003623D031